MVAGIIILTSSMDFNHSASRYSQLWVKNYLTDLLSSLFALFIILFIFCALNDSPFADQELWKSSKFWIILLITLSSYIVRKCYVIVNNIKYLNDELNIESLLTRLVCQNPSICEVGRLVMGHHHVFDLHSPFSFIDFVSFWILKCLDNRSTGMWSCLFFGALRVGSDNFKTDLISTFFLWKKVCQVPLVFRVW